MSIYEYDEEKQREFDREEGRADGIKEGEDRLEKLMRALLDAGENEKMNRCLVDAEYRTQLYKEYQI